jgi:hypothetical protein
VCACVSVLAAENKKRAARYRSLFGVYRYVFKTLLPKYVEVFVSVLFMCAGFFGVANDTHIEVSTNSACHSECYIFCPSFG